MTKIRRGNFIFVSWIGDYSPHHFHVYKDGKLVVKWDLENSREMEGKATRRVLQHIQNLMKKGRL